MSIGVSAAGEAAISAQGNATVPASNPPPRRTTRAKADLASQPEPR